MVRCKQNLTKVLFSKGGETEWLKKCAEAIGEQY
jgi:hypothetical protein